MGEDEYMMPMFEDDNNSEAEYHQYLCSQEAFDKWASENYPVGNGDMLQELQENQRVVEKYLAEMGLPLDLELV